MARDGLLVIDKPAGLTSHDVVQRVRKVLGQRRVGHGGTLDPDATGVLLVAAGQATRFFPFLAKEDKVYAGRIRLGLATDTYDASGRPLGEPCLALPDRAALAAAMAAFVGDILQTPPRFSAKKLGGRPAHRLARAEEEFDLAPVRVRIGRFDLMAYEPPDVDFEAACSSGTYIRSLAHDLGRSLGCGAHLAALRRTRVGSYGLDQAVTLEAYEEAAAQGAADLFLRPLESLLPWAPALTVRPEGEIRVRNGRLLGPDQLTGPEGGLFDPDAPATSQVVRLFSAEGKLLGLARSVPGKALHPFLVLP